MSRRGRRSQYPRAVWEADDTLPDGGYWVFDAEVAEIDFVAFSSKRQKSKQFPKNAATAGSG